MTSSTLDTNMGENNMVINVEWNQIIIAVIAAGLGNVVLSLFNRKRTVAEATDKIAEAAGKLVDRLQLHITNLEEQVTKQAGLINNLNTQVAILNSQVNMLSDEVSRLGGDPSQFVKPLELDLD